MSEQQFNSAAPFEGDRSPDTPATPEPRSEASSQQQQNMPSEAQDLPEGARNMFMAAFTSAQNDGVSQEGAINIAWNSVRNEYERGEDGKWYSKPSDPGIHHKAVTSGGN